MNTELANNVIEIYGEPTFQVSNTPISFARQKKENIVEIEAMSDEDLIAEYKSMVWLNYIYGQVSVNDLQRIDLLDLEISSRESIKSEDLEAWYKEAEEKFDINDYCDNNVNSAQSEYDSN